MWLIAGYFVAAFVAAGVFMGLDDESDILNGGTLIFGALTWPVWLLVGVGVWFAHLIERRA